MKKRMVLWTALALCAGLLCGCGDGSPASRTESTPAETSLPESQASLAGKDSSQGPREHGEAAALAGRRRNGGAFLGWARAGQRVRGGRSRKPVDRLRRRPACGMRWGKLPAGGGGVGLHGTRHLGQLGGLGWLRLVLCGNYRIAAGKGASPLCIENTILKVKAVAFFPVLWYISHQ